MELLGIKFVGVNTVTAHKLVLTLAFIVTITLIRRGLHTLVQWYAIRHRNERTAFWARQAISLSAAVLMLIAVLSIWFDDPTRLATGLGLVSAGLAFALQKVVTSCAGYIVIMRGKTFNVGERISMGGVRGDVIALGFIQTTILEMGQPPSVQSADPAMWVGSRQFTGRIVTVTNDKIFEEPVYNYTRDFPFIWEEIKIPVKYDADRDRAEAILLDAVSGVASEIEKLSAATLGELERKYLLKIDDLVPRVYYRITDNWLELTVRFIVHDHGVRAVKDAINRRILRGLDDAGIGIASATYDIVGLPPIEVRTASPAARPVEAKSA